MPLDTKVGLGPCHIVLDGQPARVPERGTAAPSLFSAHVYCGHGCPSQVLLNSCYLVSFVQKHAFNRHDRDLIETLL